MLMFSILSFNIANLFTSSVVERLSKDQSPSTGLCYFFCDGNYGETQDVQNILGSLCKQLLYQSPVDMFTTMMREVQLTYEESSLKVGNKGGRKGTLLSLLNTLCLPFNSVYIILDGLDECATREELLDAVKGMAFGPLKVLASSRRERDIEMAFQGKQCLKMDDGFVRRDIAIHIEW